MTVIESVLKIRNAPANRAIAAISAVVAWKSAVEARSDAARSCGDETTYGSTSSPASRAAVTAAAVGARLEADVDAGHAGLVEDRLGRVAAARRPSARATASSGPSPATMPTTR